MLPKLSAFRKKVLQALMRAVQLIQRALESSDPGASENFKADEIGSK